MSFDGHINLASSTIVTAPSPATSGTSFNVVAGQGSWFPSGSFQATLSPPGVRPRIDNSEIVRCTVSGDTFTIVRAQESTTAQAVTPGWIVTATVTVAQLTAIENSVATTPETFPGAADNNQLDAAIASLLTTGGVIRLKPGKSYTWSAALTSVDWAQHGKQIIIEAWGASVTYTGTGAAFTSYQSSTSTSIRTLTVLGGEWITTTGSDFFLLQDVNNALFFRCRGNVPSGNFIHSSNVRFWSERNHFIDLDDAGCQHVWTPTVDGATDSVTTSSSSPVIPDTALVSAQVGNAITGANIPANTFVGPSSIPGTSIRLSSSATVQTDVNATASGATTVHIAAQGSFARTVMRDLRVQNGTSGSCKVNISDTSSSVYDSLFHGMSGNLTDGVILMGLSGNMGGTVIGGNIGVEDSTGPGTASYFTVGTLSGTSPHLEATINVRPSMNLFDAGSSATTGVFGVSYFPQGVNAWGALRSGRLSNTLSANGAVTFFTANANYADVILNGHNCTGVTLGGPPATITGLPGVFSQDLTLRFTQNASGGQTYVWPTNCRFAGGSAPSDTTGNTATSVTFVWSPSASLWLEAGRAVAVPVV